MTEAFKPLKTGDHTLQQLLLQQAQALLEKLPNSTQLDQRLQHAILTGLQKDQYQIDFIAEKLGLSVRQLQRHLQQQDTTFQARVQQVRFMLATEYLKDPHLSLQEIALLLCYSEQSAFQRAFKLWTGKHRNSGGTTTQFTIRNKTQFKLTVSQLFIVLQHLYKSVEPV